MASKLANPDDKIDLLCVEKWFHCRNEKCSRLFYSIPALKEHFMEKHPGEELKLPENLSPEVMEGKVVLTEKPKLRTWMVNCRAGCFQSFRSQSELNFHMKKHPKCYLPYANDAGSSKFGSHLNSASNGEPSPANPTKITNKAQKPVKTQRKRLNKPGLGQKRPNASSLRLLKKGFSSRKPKTPDSQLHRCRTCSKSFANRGGLTRHIETHSGKRPFQCKICRGRFSRNDSLTFHLKTVHQLGKDAAKLVAVAAKIVAGKKQAAALDKQGAELVAGGEKSRKKKSLPGKVKRPLGRPKKHTLHKCPHCPFQGLEGTIYVKNHKRLHKDGEGVHCPICKWFVRHNYMATHHSSRHADIGKSSTSVN